MKGNYYLLKTVPNLSLFLFSVLALLLCSLQETYEAKRKEFLGDLQRKEEEMRQMFVNKVKETEAELKDKEREVSLEKPSCRLFDSQLHLSTHQLQVHFCQKIRNIVHTVLHGICKTC